MKTQPHKFRVEFIEVGRNKRSFTETFPELDETKLANCARKNAGLASRCIEFSENEEPFSGYAHGHIHAGFHTVGKWRAYRLEPVTESASAPEAGS